MSDEPSFSLLWKRVVQASSPSMLRGGAGMAIFIAAYTWMPDAAGVVDDYTRYGFVGGAAASGLQTLFGMLKGR